MRLRNNIFAAAFDYLKREKGIKTQKKLAELMGVSEDTITRILKDRCEVTEDIITKLQTASGCIFNLQWLRGEDPNCMLMEDLAYYQQHPEERLVFEKKPQEPTLSLPDDNTFMMSKMYESLVKPIEAAHAQQVATLEHQVSLLERQLADKNHQIASLEKDKEELRLDKESLNRRVRELESRLFQYESGHKFDNFPFPQGVAEKDDIRSTHV